MIKKPIKMYDDNRLRADAAVADALSRGGVYVPKISRIMFNSGKKAVKSHSEKFIGPDGHEGVRKIIDESRPVLATVIEFTDGTKVSVTNSVYDGLTVDANGNPTREAKERGIIYALAKRILSGQYDITLDGELTLATEGFGRILNDLVDSAYDFQLEAAKAKAAKAEAQRKHAELQANAKLRNSSLADCVNSLKSCIDTLRADLEALRAER